MRDLVWPARATGAAPHRRRTRGLLAVMAGHRVGTGLVRVRVGAHPRPIRSRSGATAVTYPGWCDVVGWGFTVACDPQTSCAPAAGPHLAAITSKGPEHLSERVIGLALSGGGSRAAAFHLGCLRALHDRDLLRRVRVISVISGGRCGGSLGLWPTRFRRIRGGDGAPSPTRAARCDPAPRPTPDHSGSQPRRSRVGYRVPRTRSGATTSRSSHEPDRRPRVGAIGFGLRVKDDARGDPQRSRRRADGDGSTNRQRGPFRERVQQLLSVRNDRGAG